MGFAAAKVILAVDSYLPTMRSQFSFAVEADSGLRSEIHVTNIHVIPFQFVLRLFNYVLNLFYCQIKEKDLARMLSLVVWSWNAHC